MKQSQRPLPRRGHAADIGEVRFSRRLAVFHMISLLAMIVVVLSSVLWISFRHNDLAQNSARRMVTSAVAAFQQKMETVVRDYSIWDEALEAVAQRNVDWLHSSIGSAAADIGTLDLVVIAEPDDSWRIAWRAGSELEGEAWLLEPALRAGLMRMLDGTDPASHKVRTAFAEHDGSVWSFAITRIVPIGEVASDEAYPIQIHGLNMTSARLATLGANILMDDLQIAADIGPELDGMALKGFDGAPVGYLVWAPPAPGESILRQVALPLLTALVVIAGFAMISSRYAVRSASRLESALEAAQVADRTKTEFLSNVSHELRTPMNGILGVVQLLKMTDLDEEQSELLEVLSTSAETQMSLVSDLLEIMQIESGARRLVSKPFQPAVVAGQVADLLRPVAAKKGVAVEADIEAAAGLEVLGDARAFRQIVTNLAGNAVKFTHDGSVRIKLDAITEGDGVALRCAVADTGIGIPAEHQQRIFDRFAQVGTTLTRETDGIGLGLAISQSLAEMMGGRIGLTSVLGEGSTFTFTADLPRAAGASALSDAA